MKILILSLCIVIAIVCARFISLSKNATVPNAGLEENKLRPCPGKPNCLCSDWQGQFYIEPLSLHTVTDMQQLVRLVEKMGGEIQLQEANYIWATFTSRIFRFVDDLELRIDWAEHQTHVRSESRSGQSDFGVNRKRVLKLQQLILNAADLSSD